MIFNRMDINFFLLNWFPFLKKTDEETCKPYNDHFWRHRRFNIP